MDVVLPDYGCNILSSSTNFYNYSNNNRTRETYIIFDGVAHLQSTNTQVNAYNYTGTCLSTGDLVYRPEVRVYFPILAFASICFITILIYKIFIKRLMP